MPDSSGSATWSPEQVWSLLDQSLLRLKTRKIAKEMQGKNAQDKRDVHSEMLEKNNSAYYAPERCRRAVQNANEWAEKHLEVCLDIWKTQGHEPCPGLYRAVYRHRLTTLFDARESAVGGDLRADNARTGHRYVNTDAALDTFAHDMQILRSDWADKLETLARECAYSCRKIGSPMSHDSSVADPVKQPKTPAGGTDVPPLLLRYHSDTKRAIMFQLFQKPDATDLEVCRALDADGGIELLKNWKRKPEDRLFVEVYRDSRKRNLIESMISKVRADLSKMGLL